MKTYTNLTWPDDPYRTGQQLYRKPLPRLASFTVLPHAGQGGLTAAAIVYLPLHRTQALAVTEETVSFGFRALSMDDNADMPALAAVSDLDLMQARRHAAILAGYMLSRELAFLRRPIKGFAARGVEAVQREWADRRTPSRGTAQMFDCHTDLPGRPSIEVACRCANLIGGLGRDDRRPNDPQTPGDAAALAVDRALAVALICARHLNRYTWEDTLHTAEIVAANAWDCFPLPFVSMTTTAAGSNAPQAAS
jgi:hypothetical protein